MASFLRISEREIIVELLLKISFRADKAIHQFNTPISSQWHDLPRPEIRGGLSVFAES